jgi:segregation and condensation protein B
MRSSRLIEAVLFASDAPVRVEDLARLSEELDEERVEEALAELRAEYEAEDRAFGLFEIGAGYQILTRPEFAPVLESFETVPVSSRLSRPALETLAIIAYRQPVGRAEIEDIRGVGSGGVLRTLVEREMVEVVGRGEGLGRPLLYGTTGRFLEHFGFRTIEDLPRPEELSVVLAARDPEPGTEPETEPEAQPGIKEEGDGG